MTNKCSQLGKIELSRHFLFDNSCIGKRQKVYTMIFHLVVTLGIRCQSSVER